MTTRLLAALAAFVGTLLGFGYLGLVLSISIDPDWPGLVTAALLFAPLAAIGAATFPFQEPPA